MPVVSRRLLCALVLGVVLLSWSVAAASRPNIVLILADDMRPDTIRALGNKEILTPNLDELVHRGTAFTRAHIMGSTVGAVCMPSRAMLMTGKQLFRFDPKKLGALPTNHVFLPSVFREAGYRDYIVGKWHNGGQSLSAAFSDGTNLFLGGMTDHFKVKVHAYSADGRYPTSQAVTAEGHSTDVFASAAKEFIARQDASKPFFLYLPFTAPHDPRQAPEGYLRMYTAETVSPPRNFRREHAFNNGEMLVRDEELLPWPRTVEAVRAEVALYYAMITHMDARIGELMAQLKEKGLLENTIVVFASDNGLALGSHGLLGKQNLYEHSLGVPLIVTGPGVAAGRRSDALVYLHDLNPTLCELAGLKAPTGQDAQSFAGVLAGTTNKHRDELFYAYGNVQRGITDGRFKLIRYTQINKTQIFDLPDDAREQKDISTTPEGVSVMFRLTARLQELQTQLGDTLPYTTATPAPLHIPLIRDQPKASGGK